MKEYLTLPDSFALAEEACTLGRGLHRCIFKANQKRVLENKVPHYSEPEIQAFDLWTYLHAASEAAISSTLIREELRA